MTKNDRSLRTGLPAAVTALALLAAPAIVTAADVDFSHDVVPVLRKHCVACHGGNDPEGGFSLNTRELLLESGHVEPGKPGESYLLELISSRDPDQQMPPKERARASADEVDVIRRWIEQGAPWEAGFAFTPSAYEPPLEPLRPELPPACDGRTHPIDRILDAYLAEHRLPRPEPIDDATFLRRASLDLIGLLPEPEELAAFLQDASPEKRTRKIRELLDRDIDYADHWLTFYNDLLRNDYSGTGFITGGRKQISGWLYEALVTNKPFDAFARELIAPPTSASQGYIDGIRWRGNVSAGQTVEIQFAQSVSQSFLGINLKCASCHDSFIDRWTLDDAYGLAAIYASSPLEMHRCDKPVGKQATAAWLFPELGQIDAAAPREARLQGLAELMTHPRNGRFTRTIVNRLWYKLMGHGLVHPLDAMQTEPWNAELLNFLAVSLSDHEYDLKHVLELIATSEAYQSRSEVLEGESAAEYHFAGPRARRMTAEQFLDAVWKLTGAAPVTFAAPVFRGKVDPEKLAAVELQAQWIWGDVADGPPPAGQQFVFRKVLKLDQPVDRGAAIITCDNSFTLFINGREVDKGDDWTKLHGIALHGRLKQGDNQIVVLAQNAGNAPNAAGLFFEAHLQLQDGRDVSVATDATWEYSAHIPNTREGRVGGLKGPWKPAGIVPPVKAWTNTIDGQARRLLATGVGADMPMVRASLLENNALMRSLGRPIRDQIVSMRPNSLTTLEAIDLANEPGLAKAFAEGGRRLSGQPWQDTDELIRYIFRYALSRDPTDAERDTLREMLGDKPPAERVSDALWAVCMLPEFMLVR